MIVASYYAAKQMALGYIQQSEKFPVASLAISLKNIRLVSLSSYKA